MLSPRIKIFFYCVCFVFFTIVITSCDNRPAGVLNQHKMISFLTDLHKLDGTLEVSGLGTAQDRENVYYYNALLKKYGITKDEFDSSLVWYTKNPKKFDKIYTQVIIRLNFEDSVLVKKRLAMEDSVINADKIINIWNKNNKYLITKDSARTKIDFEIKGIELHSKDIYELTFLQRIAPSDSSSDKHVVFRIHYVNGPTDSIYTKTKSDSILRRYKLHLTARQNLKIERITGSLLGYRKFKGKQNALVDSILFTRQYSPKIQQSLREEELKAEAELHNNNIPRRRLPHMPKCLFLLKNKGR